MPRYPSLDEIETYVEIDYTALRFGAGRFRDNREPSTRGNPLSCRGCWCGQPNGHGWPGKPSGVPHLSRSR
jgi:hypothetical protein